ncbi:3-keto-disaccharide hydrolase [Bythopirellula goksoeyrii]|uniref:3-keto-alpha-glucoside-1,2-lyase/3-keto-2-hydroxy-glucal hydratase domain-containing protein n=1 Tax=Bythopirellula goksoeyrii TaxID=1400387 RepID=A0A5B9QIM1_9BACT|nr:DUF1080 domain-containing protein [Bythopirellula goksoeyrii]QEG36866.1 hypothetical protein Pr1d_42030 [Bythopirellula goksoeyrii]
MQLKSYFCLAIALCLFFESQYGAAEDNWIELFNGKDTSGWTNPYEWGQAEVVDGEIHLTADKKFFLVTDREFGDFVFEGEVKLPEGQANSGFMFRCHVEPNKVYGYQAEVDGSDRNWSGGLYDEGRRQWVWPSLKGRTTDEKLLEYEQESHDYFKRPEVAKAFDRDGWNRYRITCKGDSIKIEVNDVVTTDIHDDVDSQGPIAIQHHGEKGQTYKFRNLRVRELE